MSAVALVHATLARLRDGLDLTQANSEMMPPDGKPPAFAGEVFYAVWFGNINQTDMAGESLDEQYTNNLTITMRSGRVPKDRQGTDLLYLKTTGLYARAEAARILVHMDYDLMNVANAIITAAGAANGFEEPLILTNIPQAREVGSTWFGGKGGAADSGWALTLAFGRARRLQKLEEMT